jgi:para-nitrobenzyl esterase
VPFDNGGSQTGSTNEDCLFLNVYTPSNAPRGPRLPVLVWIHGGGYTNGAGSDFVARRLAASGIIVVTTNYRLGALGFLALPQLSSETAQGSGNYGLLDQQAALRWVRRNVAAFGGDGSRVTVAGESAGGGSVCSNLASPSARGLFQQAIAQSGCALPSPTLAVAEASGQSFASALACGGAQVRACLRSRTAAEILAASGGGLGAPGLPALQFGPTAGTPVLPLQVQDALTRGRFNKVPLLQGSNHDEGRLFVGISGLTSTPAAAYPQVVQGIVGAAAAPAVLAAYPLSPTVTAPDALGAILTDSQFACPALRVNQVAQSQVRTYGYEFNDPAAGQNIPLPSETYPFKAAHATELGYLFDLAANPVPVGSERLSAEMIGYWTRFVATGNPNRHGAPVWTPLTRRHQNLQNLLPTGSRPLPAASFSADHRCALWASLPPTL